MMMTHLLCCEDAAIDWYQKDIEQPSKRAEMRSLDSSNLALDRAREACKNNGNLPGRQVGLKCCRGDWGR